MFEHRRETVLIFEWIKLPKEQKEYIKNNFDHFYNDCLLRLGSEFTPYEDNQTWGETLSRQSITDYHRDQVETNNYDGDLDKFIEAYGLGFEAWMLDQNIDLTGVKTILIDVRW